MHEQRADALQLAVGHPAALVTSGGTRAITRDPLSDGQIVGLIAVLARQCCRRNVRLRYNQCAIIVRLSAAGHHHHADHTNGDDDDDGGPGYSAEVGQPRLRSPRLGWSA